MALPRLFTRLSATVAAAAVIAATGVSAAPAAAGAEDVVSFGSFVIRDCFDAALGLPAGTELTVGQVASVVTVDCTGPTVRSLAGLESATSLESLSLRNVGLSPDTRDPDLNAAIARTMLEPLTGLPALASVWITGSMPYDIGWDALGTLPRLTSLTTSWVPDEGFGGLAGAAATLRSLRVAGATTGLDGIGALTGLTSVDIEGTGIGSIDPLAPLTALERLRLYGTSTGGDLEALAGMTLLRELDLTRTAVTSLAGLEDSGSLETLRLSAIPVDDADLATVAALPRLTSLTIFGARDATDLSPLSGNVRLQRLAVTGAAVTDISPLATIPTLQHVSLGTNHIQDFSPLGALALTDYSAQGQTLDLGTVSACDVVALPRFVTRDGIDFTASIPGGIGASDGISGIFTGQGVRTLSWWWHDYDPALGYYYDRVNGKVTVTVLPAAAPCDWTTGLTLTTPGAALEGEVLDAGIEWPAGPRPSVTITWVDQNDKAVATGNPIVVPPGTGGKTLRARIVPTTYGFDQTPVLSSPVAVTRGLPATLAISIQGTPRAFETLSVDVVDRPVEVGLDFQWLRDGVPIPGATKHYYIVPTADAGRTLTVAAHASDTYGRWQQADLVSAPVEIDPVVRFWWSPVPTIGGTPTVGRTLTAAAGEWYPRPGRLAYQWYRDGVAIKGATAATYTATSTDLDRRITVRVTATRTGFLTTKRTSAPVVIGRKLAAGTPTVIGTVKVGQTVKGTTGTWGPGAVSVARSWRVGGRYVATGSSYTIKPTDAFSSLFLRATGSKPGYTTEARWTNEYVIQGLNYTSCTALRRDYPEGVTYSWATKDMRDGVLVKRTSPTTFSSVPMYKLNAHLDKDKDGWICE